LPVELKELIREEFVFIDKGSARSAEKLANIYLKEDAW
jgi:hypothetical protein